jgi:hypothetical protein
MKGAGGFPAAPRMAGAPMGTAAGRAWAAPARAGRRAAGGEAGR